MNTRATRLYNINSLRFTMKRYYLSLFLLCFLSASPLFATQKDTIFVADYGVTPDTYENQTERLEAAIADCKRFNSKVLVFENVMTCGQKAQPTRNSL